MENLAAYIPLDRRWAISQNKIIPDRGYGSVLFADISGFTHLTEALAHAFGPRRGSDELTKQLNLVYTALIAQVHRYGGSVIGFSGDAITCWFADIFPTQLDGVDHKLAKEVNGRTGQGQSALLATFCANAMHQAMEQFANVEIRSEVQVHLSIKVAVATGMTRRFVVGDPSVRLLDVLAGATLDRMAEAEQLAQQGEIVLDMAAATAVQRHVRIRGWRENPETENCFALIAKATAGQAIAQLRSFDPKPDRVVLSQGQLQQWLLPSVYARMREGQSRFVAELRPGVTLFLRFRGLDFERDLESGIKLDQYIRWVQRVLTRYEGSLIQLTTGDKGSYLYAVFGAPVAHDDDAIRAITAALDLRTSPQRFDFIQGVQLGISQGRLRVGAYGSETRRTYGALGDATNLAARLMVTAQSGQILLCERMYERSRHLYQLEDLGLFSLKGKREPHRLHNVIQRHAQAATQFKSLYADPLVGRDVEVAQVEKLIKTVMEEESGHILRVEGEAGVGKSHLAATISQRASQQGMLVVIGACQSISRDIAYTPIRQIARYLLGLSNRTAMPSESEQQAQIEQVRMAVEQINPDWLLRLPLLGELLGLPIPDNETTLAFDAQLRQEALIALAMEILQAGARIQPLLLLVEDAHWMDESSQAITLALGRVIANTPILLTLLHRPPLAEQGEQANAFLSELADLPKQTPLQLKELTPDGTEALVRHRLQGSIAPLGLELIQSQAHGNPFFTEELIDNLLESRRLVKQEDIWVLSSTMMDALHAGECLVRTENGSWALDSDAVLSSVELGIPDTIHGMVLSRLDRLPEAVKLTLKVASVIGRVFEFDMLACTHPHETDPQNLRAQIETLQARDFAHIETPDPRLSYIFKHNITQEVAYRTLLENQRHELHLAVAQQLETLQPDAIERLAHHYHNSDLSQPTVQTKTLHYLDAAGQHAKREYANETALSYFDKALALQEKGEWLKAKIEVLHILGRREEERLTLECLEQISLNSRFDSALLWSKYYEEISQYKKAQEFVEHALSICQNENNLRDEIHCLILFARILGKQGNYTRMKKQYHIVLELIPSSKDFLSEKAGVYYGLGTAYRETSQYDKAIEHFEQSLTLMQRSGNRVEEARVLSALGFVAHFRRDFDLALHYHQRALKIRNAIGDRSGEGASLANLAQVITYSLGDYSKAEKYLIEALAIQQMAGSLWRQARILNELGVLYNYIGALEDAKNSLTTSLNLCLEIGAEAGQSLVLCNLGQALRERGEIEDAIQLHQTGIELAQKFGDRQTEANHRTELGLSYLASEQFELAIEQAGQSLNLWNSLELEILATTDLTVLALAYHSKNDQMKAVEYTQQAFNILNACNGNGPSYPQRDYLYCYHIFSANEQLGAAQQAIRSASKLLLDQAGRITDPQIRKSFLEQVSFNRAIISEKERIQ